MPTRSLKPRNQVRAAYYRNNGDMLTQGDEGWAWIGWDHGGGAIPIGPHGPNAMPILPAVTRLTAIITDTLAAAPWKVVEQGYGGKILTTPRWITDPQLLRPDDRYPVQIQPAVNRLPRTAFWAAWIRAAVWFGIGALVFMEDNEGQPVAGSLRHVHPGFVYPVRNDDNVLVWEIGDGAESVRADRDGYLSVGGERWRLLVLRDPHAPVDTEGRSVSVFERHPDVFQTSKDISSYTAGAFRSGVPNAVLKSKTPGLTVEQAREMKRNWMEAHGGPKRGVAVLPASTDFVPLSWSPVDMMLTEQSRASMAEMALAFGIDPQGALGISMGNSATYGNVVEYLRRLRIDLLPWIETVEQTAGSLLPTGRDIRMDFSEMTRPDPKTHVETLRSAVDGGLMTVDEARQRLDLGPSEGSQTSDEARSLAPAEVSQKVYLAVRDGVISVPEARQMIADAGGKIDPQQVPTQRSDS